MHVEKKRVFVGNLPLDTNEADVKCKFEKYGEVVSVEVKQKQEHSKFAFVDLNISSSKLHACFEGLKSREWKGCGVTLELAKESFLTRLQREREHHRAAQTTQQPADSSDSEDDDDEGKAASCKGKLPMFQGTSHVLQDDLSVTLTIDSLKRKRKGNDSAAETPVSMNKKPASESVVGKQMVDKPVERKNSSLSEQKRLKSLDEKRRLFNEQKKQIQSALASVDQKHALNKRVVFNSDSEEDTSVEQQQQQQQQQQSKITLFDDDSDDEDSFTINHQFGGHKGQKLLALQSSYGNDARFQLDERFRDDDDEAAEQSSDTDDERAHNLKILGSVLGHEVLPADARKHKNTLKPMLRFDPTKPEHIKYERKKTAVPAAVATVKKAVTTQQDVKVSKDKFYRVSDSLKESFHSKDDNATFSLLSMFGSHDVEVAEEKSESSARTGSQGQSQGEGRREPLRCDDEQEAGGDVAPAQQHTHSAVQLVQGDTFFFLPQDTRLAEGVKFFNKKSDPNSKRIKHFAEYRCTLKKWAKVKLKSHKRQEYTKKRGVLKRRANMFHKNKQKKVRS